MKEAATPIIAMESARPKIMTIGCSRAAPATARRCRRHGNVSHDNNQVAWTSVFRGFAFDICSRGGTAASSASMGSAGDARNSRHIFQHYPQQQNPPPSRRPTICRIRVANPGEQNAQTPSRDDADQNRSCLVAPEAGQRQQDRWTMALSASEHKVDQDEPAKVRSGTPGSRNSNTGHAPPVCREWPLFRRGLRQS